jgi:hypothetical protein
MGSGARASGIGVAAMSDPFKKNGAWQTGRAPWIIEHLSFRYYWVTRQRQPNGHERLASSHARWAAWRRHGRGSGARPATAPCAAPAVQAARGGIGDSAVSALRGFGIGDSGARPGSASARLRFRRRCGGGAGAESAARAGKRQRRPRAAAAPGAAPASVTVPPPHPCRCPLRAAWTSAALVRPRTGAASRPGTETA